MLGAHSVGEHLRGDARNRHLAGREHINEQQLIGIGKGIGKVIAQSLQTRIAVRLEYDVNMLVAQRRGSSERRLDLGGMMAIDIGGQLIYDGFFTGLAAIAAG